MLSYITCAIIASAAYLAGLITMAVRRDERLREAERSCLAATRAAAEAKNERDAERDRLFRALALRDREIDETEAKLLEAQAALVIERTPSGRPKGAA